MGDIVKNEATAAERVGGPLPFYDTDGQLKTGLTFDNATATTPSGSLHGSFEVETYSISGGWQAAAADAVELGTSGSYRLQYSQGETNFDSIIGFRLSKTGYATQYYWNRVIPASASLIALSAAVAAIPAGVWAVALEGSATAGDLMRATISGIFGKVLNFTTGTLVFKGWIDTAKTRATITTDSTGRLTSTPGDLT